ncbi:MAG: tRNA methyltransferase [Trebouxia sp. A1-2]|nr:MAG: tRNA methyltransferase [Trebouxia sp. A1-2]
MAPIALSITSTPVTSKLFLQHLLHAAPHKPFRAHDPPVVPLCTRLPLSSHRLCCGNSRLSHQQPCSAVRRKLLTSATKSARAGKADAVQAEFAKAGISAEVTLKVLKQYKSYLTWDVETKLRPALQSWLQELGTEQLSQQLQKVQRLLICKPEECSEVYSWLMSKGVNAATVQQKAPVVLTRELRAVQSTFEALQQAAAFSDEQMCTLLHKHSVALVFGPEHVLSTLQAVGLVLDMPMKSDSFREVILAANDRLFSSNPVTVHQRVTFFCQTYATGPHVARTALTSGVFVTPEPVMQSRAAKLQELLGWDSEQLKQKLSADSNTLNIQPFTLARNVHEMQGAGFSQTQVWAMCTQHPALLDFNLQMLFAVLAAVGVFLLVPRGISVGEVELQSDHMSWNTTKGTYQLKLLAKIPIYNPNYMKARIKGSLKVFFYDTEAGVTQVEQVFARPRALAKSPYMLELVVDASNVPSKYILTILSECATFPRRLIFFVKGSFGAHFLGQTQGLSPIDTYFMIDCINGGSVPPSAPSPPDLAHQEH